MKPEKRVTTLKFSLQKISAQGNDSEINKKNKDIQNLLLISLSRSQGRDRFL